MKLRWLFLLTFGSAAAVGGGAVWAGLQTERALAAPAVAVAVLVVTGLAWFLAARVREQLSILERIVAAPDDVSPAATGIRELDELAERLRDHAYRWSDATTGNREQSRLIAELLERMKRNGAEEGSVQEGAPVQQLRRLLAAVTNSAESDLQEILVSAREIGQSAQEIAAGVDDQTASVNKTTTYVEQISSNIDSVSSNAEAAQQSAVDARESAVQALELVGELIEGMDRIRLHVEAGEKKLRALGDRSHEIGSIVETIGTISSRTDLLALNASIESVRAGEHGRGFAVVADEVRSLAEQAAQATREVASLVESIQLETQESIAVKAEERAQVEAEVARVNAAGQALDRISQTSGDASRSVGEISRAAQQQLQLTQDVVLAMERISEVARHSRNTAEGVSWATKALGKLVRQLDESVSPLRGCLAGQPNGRQVLRRSEVGGRKSAVSGQGSERPGSGSEAISSEPLDPEQSHPVACEKTDPQTDGELCIPSVRDVSPTPTL